MALSLSGALISKPIGSRGHKLAQPWAIADVI